jgi:hypothetical protein
MTRSFYADDMSGNLHIPWSNARLAQAYTDNPSGRAHVHKCTIHLSRAITVIARSGLGRLGRLLRLVLG